MCDEVLSRPSRVAVMVYLIANWHQQCNAILAGRNSAGLYDPCPSRLRPGVFVRVSSGIGLSVGECSILLLP